MTEISAPAARVLVIDDDPAIRRVLSLSLLSAGLDVATADDGLMGLEKLESDEYDVIVLDLQMPNMDGRAFYREMTARGHGVEVVILSAYGAEEARRELGAAASLAKPFDPDDLIETVQRLAANGGS